MNSDRKHIDTFTRQFIIAAEKYGQIESLPIRVDEQHEVSTREAHMIEAIGDATIMNVTMLSERFGVSRSAASQMVSKLIKRGFVCKDYAPSSAKEYRLSLTELGHKAYAAHEQFHGHDRNALATKLEALAPSELDAMSDILEALINIMESRLQQHK